MGLLKSVFLHFGCNLSDVDSLKCISRNNQECKVRPEIVNVNSDEPVLIPFSCNNINGPYAKLCVPHVVKNINLKVFNLMSRTNETRRVK